MGWRCGGQVSSAGIETCVSVWKVVKRGVLIMAESNVRDIQRTSKNAIVQSDVSRAQRMSNMTVLCSETIEAKVPCSV